MISQRRRIQQTHVFKISFHFKQKTSKNSDRDNDNSTCNIRSHNCLSTALPSHIQIYTTYSIISTLSFCATNLCILWINRHIHPLRNISTDSGRVNEHQCLSQIQFYSPFSEHKAIRTTPRLLRDKRCICSVAVIEVNAKQATIFFFWHIRTKQAQLSGITLLTSDASTNASMCS